MAAIMTAPMLILEIMLMGSMYENKKALQVIFGASTLVLVMFFLFIRQQTYIFDIEFLRSMIPHHSGAILMCEQATLADAELQDLCVSIVEQQKEEIDQMESILTRLNQKSL